MNDVDCVIKRDVYPQNVHSRSKNIRGISFFVLEISVIYIMGDIAWIFASFKDKKQYKLLRWHVKNAAKLISKFSFCLMYIYSIRSIDINIFPINLCFLPLLEWTVKRQKLSSINPSLHRYTFWRINNSQLLKHCGKRRNCSLRAISPFPTMFLLNQIIVSPFVHIFDITSLFAVELEKLKIGVWRKGLTCQK